MQTVDPNFLRQLAGIGNNLNQIARAVNIHQSKPLERVQILAALASIQRELAALKDDKVTKSSEEMSHDS